MNRPDDQWVLSGFSSRYLVVPWYNKSARDPPHQVSAVFALHMLNGWLTSRRIILREIYSAMEGHFPSTNEQCAVFLTEAFRTGRLMLLRVAAPEVGEARSSGRGTDAPGGPFQGGPKTDVSVILELEWPEAVIEQFPADVSLVLSRSGQPSRTYTLGMAIREDGVARLSLGGFSGTEKLTLTARKEQRELVLFRDQSSGDLKWEHSLEELLEPETTPTQPVLVNEGRTPDDALSEPDTAVLLEV